MKLLLAILALAACGTDTATDPIHAMVRCSSWGGVTSCESACASHTAPIAIACNPATNPSSVSTAHCPTTIVADGVRGCCVESFDGKAYAVQFWECADQYQN